MEKETILEVKNLTVALDKEIILNGLSFEVAKGDALAVIGPNGAGKSVLFRTLVGLLSHEGSIRWKKGIKIGYAPQRFVVDRTVPITVKEFFLFKSKSFWKPSRTFVKHLDHELDLVGLDKSILEKPLSEISGGQLQRVLIAWVMLDHPDVLLFDEPTTGIDVGFEKDVYKILHSLQTERGTTILLISHELNVVYKYADGVLCLNKEMICYGAPSKVLNQENMSQLYDEHEMHGHEHRHAK